VWYLEIPDAARLSGNWNAGLTGKFFNEPAIIRTLRNNRFGLEQLFSDLPEAVVSPARIRALAGAVELGLALGGAAERASLAAYLGSGGRLAFLLLLDVGLDRLPAFGTMGEWETSFYVDNPEAEIVRGDHGGNFLDVWRLNPGGGPLAGEIALGFAENLAVVSNDAAVANACLELLAGGESLGDSVWGGRLAASRPRSSSADAVSFLRPGAVLDGLGDTPLARRAVKLWADCLGHGDAEGGAVYYGLEFTPEGVRESYQLPLSGEGGPESLAGALASRLEPSASWTVPQALPYQPNPVIFLAARMDGEELGRILERRGGIGEGILGEFQLPEATRDHIFGVGEVLDSLTGEVGIAWFPRADGGLEWLLALACSGNPQPALEKGPRRVERNRTAIFSLAQEDWLGAFCWAVATPGNLRRLSGDFLLLASSGELMVSTLDQLLSGASFVLNRDFARELEAAEDGHGLLFYFNLPEILVRQYPNLSQIARGFYPRSPGLNSRPPLNVLRRYARGALGAVNPAPASGGFVRATVQSPLPSFFVLAAGSVLRFPMNLRIDGRAAMEKSRENLKNIWLKLLEYSGRFGHFPASLDDLRRNLAEEEEMDRAEIEAIFTAPAALSRLTAAEAIGGSYNYLSGAVPNDEPDLPLVYEARPWSEDFAGMYPADPSRPPAETGEFLPYRQYVRLDGEVASMPENRFRETVMPRLAERE
jgi:hypothetical protein